MPLKDPPPADARAPSAAANAEGVRYRAGRLCLACGGRGSAARGRNAKEDPCLVCEGSGAGEEALRAAFPGTLAAHPKLIRSGPWRARGERPRVRGDLLDGAALASSRSVEVLPEIPAYARTLVASAKGTRLGLIAAKASPGAPGIEVSPRADPRSTPARIVDGFAAAAAHGFEAASSADPRVGDLRWTLELSVDIGPAIDCEPPPAGCELAVALALLGGVGALPRARAEGVLAWASLEGLRIKPAPECAATELLRCHSGPVIVPGPAGVSLVRKWPWFELWRVQDLRALLSRLHEAEPSSR